MVAANETTPGGANLNPDARQLNQSSRPTTFRRKSSSVAAFGTISLMPFPIGAALIGVINPHAVLAHRVGGIVGDRHFRASAGHRLQGLPLRWNHRRIFNDVCFALDAVPRN